MCHKTKCFSLVSFDLNKLLGTQLLFNLEIFEVQMVSKNERWKEKWERKLLKRDGSIDVTRLIFSDTL